MPAIERGLTAEALFDQQLSTYEALGFTALVEITQLEELKAKLLDEIETPNTPAFFSLAIPEVAVPLNEQLRLAHSRAFLRAENMVNTEVWEYEPTSPYVLLDVHDGHRYRGKPAETAAEEITARGRHCFRIAELVSLSIHAPELWLSPNRGLFAADTLHPEAGQEPATIDFYRFGDGGLKVKRDPGTISDSDWTTPHYGDRVVVN